MSQGAQPPCLGAQASDWLGREGSLRRVRDGMAAASAATGGGASLGAALAAWRARRGVALDITAHPGLDYLSAKAGCCNLLGFHSGFPQGMPVTARACVPL